MEYPEQSGATQDNPKRIKTLERAKIKVWKLETHKQSQFSNIVHFVS